MMLARKPMLRGVGQHLAEDAPEGLLHEQVVSDVVGRHDAAFGFRFRVRQVGRLHFAPDSPGPRDAHAIPEPG